MKQGGLLFPKEPVRKKRKKHHKSIIDRDVKDQCFICQKRGYTERHHIYAVQQILGTIRLNRISLPGMPQNIRYSRT